MRFTVRTKCVRIAHRINIYEVTVNEYVTFLMQNWYLTLAFFAILLAIIAVEYQEGQKSSHVVSTDELTKMVNRDNAVVLDVRDETSYKSGHIVDSLWFSTQNLEKSIKSLKKHKSKPCVLVDADGKSVGSVISQCKEQGFERVVGLQGGIAAWKDAGMPLITKE